MCPKGADTEMGQHNHNFRNLNQTRSAHPRFSKMRLFWIWPRKMQISTFIFLITLMKDEDIKISKSRKCGWCLTDQIFQINRIRNISSNYVRVSFIETQSLLATVQPCPQLSPQERLDHYRYTKQHLSEHWFERNINAGLIGAILIGFSIVGVIVAYLYHLCERDSDVYPIIHAWMLSNYHTIVLIWKHESNKWTRSEFSHSFWIN